MPAHVISLADMLVRLKTMQAPQGPPPNLRDRVALQDPEEPNARDLAEAQRIANGVTGMAPEPRHLVALVRALDEANAECEAATALIRELIGLEPRKDS